MISFGLYFVVCVTLQYYVSFFIFIFYFLFYFVNVYNTFRAWDRPGILLESRWWSLKGRNSAVRFYNTFCWNVFINFGFTFWTKYDCFKISIYELWHNR